MVKTSNLLLLGIAGVTAYFLYKNPFSKQDEQVISTSPGYNNPVINGTSIPTSKSKEQVKRMEDVYVELSKSSNVNLVNNKGFEVAYAKSSKSTGGTSITKVTATKRGTSVSTSPSGAINVTTGGHYVKKIVNGKLTSTWRKD